MRYETIATLTDETYLITPLEEGQALHFNGDRYTAPSGEPIRVYGTGPVEISQGKWGNRLRAPGIYTGGYFDGSTPSNENTIYYWNGTPNASTSTMRRLGRNSGANRFVLGGGTSGMKFVNNSFNRTGYSAVIGKGLESAGVQLKEVGSWLP